ncbi:phosphatase PAP2 family protein [Kitasatospora sp. DSM 101779]|uniref:phosphatase PAP2 family protein n=1 Tax=Kitasatospora sp. DSM 101779 TaxID=2853165 RepID=UPI0021D87682|nr:phosphatase PAP2 family protein [Kitasatospora sp. DSM 101779]MCU7820931.1 phosphatase PAP2 family protein [Kitasatospora sp. DSM 101779]
MPPVPALPLPRPRVPSAARLVAAATTLIVLAVCAPVTWNTLAEPVGRPSPVADLAATGLGGWYAIGTRAVLLAVALASVLAAGLLLARDPPPGLPHPGAVGSTAAGALLLSADLRGQPVDAVLGLAAVTLALAEMLPRTRPPEGLALGTAIALEPALALFAVLLVCRRDRRRALNALVLALALNTAAWAARPLETARGWRQLIDPLLAVGPDNQSAYGLLLRLGLRGPLLAAVCLAAAVLVGTLAIRRGLAYTADGQHLLATGVVGCAAVVVSPLTGPAAFGWLLAAAVGRLGRRPEDRALWPVVAVTVALLSSSMLDPQIEPVTTFLLRGAAPLTAAAAAALLSFRSTTDPLWTLHRTPAPTPHHPFGRRRLPLLPATLRPVSRPNLLMELLFIQVGYGIYTKIRNAAPNRIEAAVEHARDIYGVERFLRIDVERAVNGWVLHTRGMLDLSLQYYKTFHLIGPLAVLGWLYLRHPRRYRTSRTVLFTATGLALLGFWGYPLAPPRLTPGLGLRDSPFGGPDGSPLGALTALTNQFAAMPSLHCAWAFWCAAAVIAATRRRWVWAVAVVYPLLTLFVVVATANHWLLDAVGGVAVVLAGCLFQYVLTGRRMVDRSPVLAARVRAWSGRPRPGGHPTPTVGPGTSVDLNRARGPAPPAPSAEHVERRRDP